MKLKKVGGKILNLLFPPRCPWCGKVVGANTNCCAGIVAKQALPPGPLNLAQNNQICPQLANVWACYWYDTPVSDAIQRFKFEDEPEAAAMLGHILAQKWKLEHLDEHFDCLVPVPSSARTLRERGYSQTLLLAQALSAGTGVPVVAHALHKVAETERQANLNRSQRLTNVLGSYAILAPQTVEGKRVCLVDDIITTGSTLNECAKTLHGANVVDCGALCLASTHKNHAKIKSNIQLNY